MLKWLFWLFDDDEPSVLAPETGTPLVVARSVTMADAVTERATHADVVERVVTIGDSVGLRVGL